MDLPLETLELILIERGLKKRKLEREPYVEAGCGDGINLERFSRMGMTGTGIDTSLEAIEIVKKKALRNTKLIHSDFLTYVPDAARPTKTVFMLNILEHVNDDVELMRKAAQVLPSGGFLVLALPANPKAYGFADANAGHVRRYGEQELKGKLESIGFMIDEWLCVGFPVNRSYTWLFNILNKGRSQNAVESQIEISGIRNRDGYYPGSFDLVAKIVFPILKVLIHIDRLFVRTKLGNNYVVFAKRSDRSRQIYYGKDSDNRGRIHGARNGFFPEEGPA